ncbi:F0F1 ATP synthase subunit A [Haloechinothrix sp. LS1_15]|uniref:F0F1 ATP synthase subunit A n=1 Tax=Haloechinothrix sp. LS1_15 TaxID=2652248 RepID=UPI002948264D|nr:F0F1 ATP synthase subunit A [Haloechinothrix sp. LS1_15]MDV6011782.1 F0F1 ATP synthase subunit A [Haloechinothrix sp. LS1_15]
MSTLVLATGETYSPPSAGYLEFPPIFGAVTKPMLLAIMATLIISVFFLAATRNMKIVPGKFQYLAESIYSFGRNNIAREQIGSAEFRPFVPLILALFTFLLVNNLFGLIPVTKFPTMAQIGFPLALSLLVVYPVYHIAGMRKHGFFGYFKNQLFPPGAPWPVYILLAPIEFFSKFVVNPLTLAVRVFAAMFAGYMLILVFAGAGTFLLVHGEGLLYAVAGLSYLGVIAITFLEALIMTIQAFIFALLSASYIGMALAEEH